MKRTFIFLLLAVVSPPAEARQGNVAATFRRHLWGHRWRGSGSEGPWASLLDQKDPLPSWGIRPFPEVIRLRGGSTDHKSVGDDDDSVSAAPTSKQKKTKPKAPAAKKKTKTKEVPALFQLRPIPTGSTTAGASPSPAIQVEALLTDRYLSWKWLTRIILMGIFAWQLQACQTSAGVARRRAIWSTLSSANLVQQQDTTTMPPSFQPSPLDTIVATTLARASRDMIPPKAMPLAGPLIGALLSFLAFIFFTVLLPHWFLKIRVWYDYQQKSSTSNGNEDTPTAVLIQVLSDNHQAKSERLICQLHRTNLRSQLEHNLPPYHFEYQHRRYYYDDTSRCCFDAGPNWGQQTVGEVICKAKKKKKKKKYYVGLLQAPSQLVHAQERWYPYNHQTSVPIPTMQQALWERLQSPLVVAQLIGKAMAVLEEGKAALWSLATTVFQHWGNARASIQSSKRLQQDVAGLAQEFSKQPVWIYRGASWKLLEASDLLPGDLFWISNNNHHHDDNDTATTQQHTTTVVPVDSLLLEGMCVTMEAVLTGESVPQTKMPIDETTPQWNQTLDMTGVHRNSVLFAGTTLLHCTSQEGTLAAPKGVPPGPGGLCLALRTGSYSSKGELIGALTSSRSKKAGAATISNPQFDKDALKLIATMSVVSVLACASLFWGSSSGRQHKVSGFRRIIQCSRIATSCIPSDLPMSLSHVVGSCAHVLRQEADVVCSQPGALLTASQIDTVVFDKTGTLTADTQALSQVIEYPNKAKSTAKKLSKSKEKKGDKAAQNDNMQTKMGNLVLAGCHSLVHVDADGSSDAGSQSMVGDPLELAALRFSGFVWRKEGGFYEPKRANPASKGSSHVVEKLWQLKVFPFSPTSRLSSAICLVRYANGTFKLFAVAKGAPAAVKILLDEPMNEGNPFAVWYDRRVQQLESKGVRAIALASKELRLPASTTAGMDASESDILSSARQFAEGFHRSDVEEQGGSSLFAGLACFNAQTRPSSKRVLGELAAGNIHSIMLTGDSMAAALAVGKKVGMLRDNTEVAALELLSPPGNESAAPELKLRISATKEAKKKEKLTPLTRKVIKDLVGKVERGETQIAASGAAIMELLARKGNSKEYDSLIDNLHSFSVVARASPDCKERFVSSLASKRVLMCGDGVNDVSAMKEAEVSVALLNGFGTESEQSSKKGIDTEDNRRKQRLEAKRQRASSSSSALDDQGIGSSAAAANARIRKRVEEAQLEITKRAIERVNGTDGNLQHTFGDIKDMFVAIWKAGAEERGRAKKLKEGGGEAASILAEEDRQMRQGTVSNSNNKTQATEIKPGEACMASPFSCLRSSIDGVEAVIRAGIATAACALSVQQKITLHSLITCFNLSALFRDGFRYGSKMSFVDMILYMLVDFASYRESCRMRPRLPRSKRPSTQSLFAPANFFSVIGQVLVHLTSTQAGISFARKLEDASEATVEAERLLIRSSASQSPRLAALTNAMVKSAASNKKNKQGGSRFLGRSKFVPNYETNVVFVLSMIQSIVTTLLLHKGAPFYLSVLESPILCLYAGLSGVFVVASILETFPFLNQLLELRPWPSRRSKFFLLGLAVADTLACAGIEFASRQTFSSSLSISNNNKPLQRSTSATKLRTTKATAADLEEEMLRNVEKKNLRLVLTCTIAMFLMTLGGLIR